MPGDAPARAVSIGASGAALAHSGRAAHRRDERHGGSMTERERDRPAEGGGPSAAAESAKVHGDKLEEMIPREPRGDLPSEARPPADDEDREAEEPRGHS
jgi:hypothetical protein